MKLVTIVLSVSLAVASMLRADPQGVVNFDYPRGTATQAMELFARLTDAHIVFREEKEMQRIVPITTKKNLKYSEAREYIVQRFRLEGLEIRKVEEGVYEVIQTLSEEEVRRLNKEAGREWNGPQYKSPSKLPHVHRGNRPESRVRYEPKKKGEQDGAGQAPASAKVAKDSPYTQYGGMADSLEVVLSYVGGGRPRFVVTVENITNQTH